MLLKALNWFKYELNWSWLILFDTKEGFPLVNQAYSLVQLEKNLFTEKFTVDEYTFLHGRAETSWKLTSI